MFSLSYTPATTAFPSLLAAGPLFRGDELGLQQKQRQAEDLANTDRSSEVIIYNRDITRCRPGIT